MTVITNFRTAVQKRAAYLRTRRELANLPIDIALDLDIYSADADRIAREAVYG